MLKEFLFAKARALFINVMDSDQTETGVRDWPTIVNWLLLNYSSDDNINRAVNQLRSARQKPEENELEYFNRFTKLNTVCGNYLSQAKLRNLFLNGLDPESQKQFECQ